MYEAYDVSLVYFENSFLEHSACVCCVCVDPESLFTFPQNCKECVHHTYTYYIDHAHIKPEEIKITK